MLRVEAQHHTTTRASWVMAVIHCHRPDIYYCSKVSVCPVPSAQMGMVIQAFYDRITGIYVKLLCVLERVSLAPVLSFPMGLLSLSLAMPY